MKLISSLLVLGGIFFGVACTKTEAPTPASPTATAEAQALPEASDADRAGGNTDLTSVYRYSALSIGGQPVSLSRYRGRKILIVNTASQCGYTPQYTDLQTLSTRYASQVVVLGFPSNDFGGQEPGTDGQIAGFCTGTYNVTFPLFGRVAVVGAAAIPLYRFLGDRARNGVTSARPTWNFCKYLIDENGHVVRFYSSAITPLSPALLADILAPAPSAAPVVVATRQ